MSRRVNAIKKLLNRQCDLSSLLERRHGNEVTIERRYDAGKIRIIKSYSGGLMPLQSIEFKLLSHHQLPKNFQHLVRYQQNSNMSGPEILMRDCGLDLDDWVEIFGFNDGSPFNDLGTLLSVWRQILFALHELHLAGFVHCDVKADNVCIPYAKLENANGDSDSLFGEIDLEKLTLIDFALSLQPINGIDPRGCYVDHGEPLIRPHGQYMSGQYLKNIKEAQRLFVASNGLASGHPAWIKLLNRIDWRSDIFSLGWLIHKHLYSWKMAHSTFSNQKEKSLFLFTTELAQKLVNVDQASDVNNNLIHTEIISNIDQIIGKQVRRIPFRVTNENNLEIFHESSPLQNGFKTPSRLINPVYKPNGANMNYAIDGNNVLLNLIVDGKPSIRLFATLLLSLKDRNYDFKLFFDDSIERRMNERDAHSDWKSLERALATVGIRPHFSRRADTPIEEYCFVNTAALINAHDKIDSWTRKPKIIHRARVGRSKNNIQLELRDSQGKFIFHAIANAKFSFGDLEFPSLVAEDVNLDKSLFRGQHDPVGLTEATLLVFALDASQSMTHTNTYDGQSKKSHLNNIMKQALKTLSISPISHGLYIAISRFSNDVSQIQCPAADCVGFASVDAWNKDLSKFDYMEGAEHGYTNIRLALLRSKELIQDVLFNGEEADRIADGWRVAIVLITDGRHVVPQEDGTNETERQVIEEVIDIDSGAAGLIDSRIDVACVGIGNDLNIDLLSKVASECTALQMRMAARKKIDSLLIGGSLFVKVDSGDVNFGSVIRTFIDVVSGSA